jgi:AcrR family transcriptional regulator
MEPKEKILARTGELFRMMGMKALTMDRVAADLGVSKRTIYEFFGDKEALMLASFDYMIKKNNQHLIEVASKSPNVIEAIFVIAEIQHRQMVTSNPIIFDDLKRFFVKLNASYYNNREKCREFSVVFNLLERGKREGVFREELKIDIVDTFMMELIMFFHVSEAMKSMKLSQEEAVLNIFMPYLRGLCTARGLELLEQYHPGEWSFPHPQ